MKSPSASSIGLLDGLTLLGLAILTGLSPWLFGGAAAGHQLVLMVAAVAGLMVCLARLIVWPESLPRVPFLGVLLVVAAFLGGFQLIRIPHGVHKFLSPQGHYWWQAAEEAAPQVDVTSHGYPLSLYPASTRRDLALFMLSAAGFFIAALHAGRRQLWMVLGLLLSVNGAVFSVFGIIQRLTYNGMIYWRVPLTEGGNPFAAYVNRNNAAGYLNLALAAALGVFAWKLLSLRETDEGEEWTYAGWSTPSWASWRYYGFLRGLNTQNLLAATVCVFIVAGILSSRSRGAALALLASSLATAIVARRVRGANVVRNISLGVLLIGTILAFSLGDATSLRQRFQTIWNAQGDAVNGRLEHWENLLRASQDYWRAGSGWGTQRFVYRAYENRHQPGWFFHAENQYLEALLEGGILGLLLLLVAVGLVLWSSAWRIWKSASPAETAMGVACFFAICSQAVHACFDFGLYLPANGLLCAVFAGLATGATQAIPHDHVVASTARRLMWLGLVSLALVAVIFALRETQLAARFELVQQVAEDLDIRQPMTADATEAPLSALREVSDEQPDLAEAQLMLANLYRLQYQATAAAQLAAATNSSDAGLIWQLSDPAFLPQRVRAFRTAGDQASLNQLAAQPAVRDSLVPAYEHFGLSTTGCPVLSKAHLGLAQLSGLLAEPERMQSHLKLSLQAAPQDPDILFAAGLLEIQVQHTVPGFAYWRRCLDGSNRHQESIMSIGSRLVSQRELIDKVLPRSAKRLVEIGRKYYADDGSADLRHHLARLASAELDKATGDKTAENLHLRGAIAELNDDPESAISHYEKAVSMDPRHLEMRYDLARMLFDAGQYDEAVRNVRVCVELQPVMYRYRNLLQRAMDQAQQAPRQ